MEYRTLGKSTLKVSAIGMGCMSMSGVYGPADDAESVKVLHHALGRGVNFWDTADMYGWGHNEEIVGKALKGQRGDVVLATKFGNTQGGVDGRPEYVRQACEASLKRLHVDVIDLYYQHRVDPKVPIEDTVGAMARLKEEGKVRYLGLSEAAPATIRRAHAVHPITAVQSEYSLLYRNPAEETLPTTRELGISFVGYSPLGRSLLTGKIKSDQDLPEGDRRRAFPRFQDRHFAQNLKLVQRIEEFARAQRCEPAQLVLAWLMAQGADIIALPGTKRISYLDENLGALDVRLTPELAREIGAALPAGSGERYPAPQMKAVQL
jgi:aryl-alcohol dehydrogenase-like predicted oxidoreductase